MARTYTLEEIDDLETPHTDRFWYYICIIIAWTIFTAISVAMVCVSAAFRFGDHDNIGFFIMAIFGVIFMAFSIGVFIGACNALLNGKSQFW